MKAMPKFGFASDLRAALALWLCIARAAASAQDYPVSAQPRTPVR
jgi:hypothetical protein